MTQEQKEQLKGHIQGLHALDTWLRESGLKVGWLRAALEEFIRVLEDLLD